MKSGIVVYFSNQEQRHHIPALRIKNAMVSTNADKAKIKQDSQKCDKSNNQNRQTSQVSQATTSKNRSPWIANSVSTRVRVVKKIICLRIVHKQWHPPFSRRRGKRILMKRSFVDNCAARVALPDVLSRTWMAWKRLCVSYTAEKWFRHAYGNSRGSTIAVTWTKWASSRGMQWRQIHRWRSWGKSAFHLGLPDYGSGEGGRRGRRVEFSLKDPKVMRVQRWKNINSFHFRFLTPDWFQIQVIVILTTSKTRLLYSIEFQSENSPFSCKGRNGDARSNIVFGVVANLLLSCLCKLLKFQIYGRFLMQGASLLHPNTSDPGFQHTDQTRARITVWH